MTSKEFGDKVRSVIDERGIKYSFIADKMGWSRQLLNKKVLGQNAWRIDEASKIMKILDLSVDLRK